MKRWLVPLVAAVAVLALISGVRWLAAPGSSGSDASFADDSTAGDSSAGGSSSAGDSADGSPAGGSSGSSSPGFPGSDGAGTDPGIRPDEPLARQTNAMGVRVDRYQPRDADRLAISYTIGVPECYGKIAEPVVEETARSVTVTLTRIPPPQDNGMACIEIALQKSVDVDLSYPLGARQVRDGSFDGAVVKPGGGPVDASGVR